MEKVTLYSYKTEQIKISMEMYFNENQELIFDGYDIGTSVEELQGDIDYEYSYTISPKEVVKFYPIFQLQMGDKFGLLQEIQSRFSVNEAYSLFGEFMKQNGIQYTSFSWR